MVEPDWTIFTLVGVATRVGVGRSSRIAGVGRRRVPVGVAVAVVGVL